MDEGIKKDIWSVMEDVVPQLRDDAGVVYYRTVGDEKRNELLAGMQREIEQNADSERRLILVCCKLCCR
jgi:hypothetical protein